MEVLVVNGKGILLLTKILCGRKSEEVCVVIEKNATQRLCTTQEAEAFMVVAAR